MKQNEAFDERALPSQEQIYPEVTMENIESAPNEPAGEETTIAAGDSDIYTATEEAGTLRTTDEETQIAQLRGELTGISRSYQEEKRTEILEKAGITSNGIKTVEEMQEEQELLAQDKNWMEALARDQNAARAENALRDLNEKIAAGGIPEEVQAQQREQQEKLQNILDALEDQRMSKDQGLLERGFQTLIEGTEKYRKLGWKSKVGVGLTLGAAGVGAAVIAAPAALGALAGVGFGMRGVGARALYMGVKERDITKAEEERMARGAETGDYNEINKIIAEHSLNKKGLALAGIMSIAIPTAIRESLHTDIGHSALEYATNIGSKVFNKAGEIIGAGLGISSAHAGELPPEILQSRSLARVGFEDGQPPTTDLGAKTAETVRPTGTRITPIAGVRPNIINGTSPEVTQGTQVEKVGGFKVRGLGGAPETTPSSGNAQTRVGFEDGRPPEIDLSAERAGSIRPTERIVPVTGYRPTSVGEATPPAGKPLGTEIPSSSVKPVEGFRVRGLGGSVGVETTPSNTQTTNIGNIEGQAPTIDLGAKTAETVRPTGTRITPIAGVRPNVINGTSPEVTQGTQVGKVGGFKVRGLGGAGATPENFTQPQQNFDLTHAANLEARSSVPVQSGTETVPAIGSRVEHAAGVSPIAGIESASLHNLSREAKQAITELFPQKTLSGERVLNQELWDRFGNQDANSILTQGRLFQVKEVTGVNSSLKQLEFANHADEVQKFLKKLVLRSGPPRPGQMLADYLRQVYKN